MAVVEEQSSLTYPQFARALACAGIEKHEYAGLPMPISGLNLHLEDKSPYFAAFSKGGFLHDIDKKGCPIDEDPDDITLLNTWESDVLDAEVFVYRYKDGSFDGKSKVYVQRYRQMRAAVSSVNAQVSAIGAMDAWLNDAEFKATDMLEGLLPKRMFHSYMLTGTFLETSKRSGMTYLFRRLKPTIAMRGVSDTGPWVSKLSGTKYSESVSVRCALCMHPVGYYVGSAAGVLTPTDDVIAHLLLMRSDEHYFWRKCNIHKLDSAGAMLA